MSPFQPFEFVQAAFTFYVLTRRADHPRHEPLNALAANGFWVSNLGLFIVCGLKEMESAMKNGIGLLVICLLSACGGGGDGPAVGSTPTNAIFPVRAAYTAFAKAGQSYNYGLSGTCGGNASQISAPATSTTYNTKPAFVKTTTVNLTINSCMAAPGTSGTLPHVGTTVSTQQIFYDPNFKPIAYVVQGVGTLNIVDNFTIPETVRVGDAGVMGSGGGFSMSYTLEPDTETTAILKLNIQMPTLSMISGTEVQTFRISTGGDLVLLADEFFSSGGYRFTLTPR